MAPGAFYSNDNYFGPTWVLQVVEAMVRDTNP